MGQIGRLKSVGGTGGGGFTEADKEILVKIVQYGQWLGVCGTKGPWIKFLATVDRAVPENHDPSKRPWNVLASFLETWKDEKALKIVQRARDYIKHQRTADVLEATELWPEYPEEKLARLTRKHPMYPRDYNFFSYQEEWVRSELVTAKDSITPPTLLGLDCEMVTCEDGSSQLVRVCLVDRDLQTVIDTLVQPSQRVIDYKSHITGVTAQDLESVTVTQKDIQSQVKETLSPETIIVGHSLHNDLKALHIDHRRVIDTAYIFHIQNRRRMWSPSLRDLCKLVLGYDFREDDKPHDCIEDAKIPMKLVLHCVKDGLKPLKIPDEVDQAVLSKLLIHKVPKDVTWEELRFLFPPNLPVGFQKVERDPSSLSKYYSIYGVFSCKEAADFAFNQLRAFATEDITGRLQKFVHIRNRFQHQNARRVSVVVRKMETIKELRGEPLDKSEAKLRNEMNREIPEEPLDESEEKLRLDLDFKPSEKLRLDMDFKPSETLRLDMDFKPSEVPETVQEVNVGEAVGTGEQVLNPILSSRSLENVKDSNVGEGAGRGEQILNSKRSRSLEDGKNLPLSPAAKKSKKVIIPLSISIRKCGAAEGMAEYRGENGEGKGASQVVSPISPKTVGKSLRQKNVPGGRKKILNKRKKIKRNKK